MQTSHFNVEMHAEYTRQRLIELRRECRRRESRPAFDLAASVRSRIGWGLIALGRHLGGLPESTAPLRQHQLPTR